jgi:two-component system cell cycle sensor histidine kinase/response regulator CckA
MEAAPRKPPLFTRRTAMLAVAAVGIVLSIMSFRDSRARERERADTEFIRRATIRHTLTREVLGRYEDSLFSLNALFSLSSNITRTEFMRAARRVEERTPGAQAYEWAPFVNADGRAEIEAAFQRAYSRSNYEVYDMVDGQRVRSPERESYLPISYVYPLAGNERALGYNLLTAPSRPYLDRARETRQLTLSHQIKLIQEKVPHQLGVVLISPVWRPPKLAQSTEPDTFQGYVQAVFRTHDLLERACIAYPDLVLDMLFVDASETDPALRLLYYRPVDGKKSPEAAPTEAEFRREMITELALPLGGRNWRVLYRPRAGWIREQFTPLAWVRVGGVLAITVLLCGLVHILGRRTEIVEGVITERTAELAESRRELDSLLHALPGMAYRCRYDDQLTVVYVSDGALSLTGRAAADFIAGRVHFRDVIHPDDLARARAATVTALEERREFEIEYRVRLPDGRENWVLSRGGGLYSADGKLDSIEGLAIDITAQKRAEYERIALERKLLEGQKLESLGLLAGGIAHDFNNLLTGILGNASLARLTLPPGSQMEAQLRAIETASLRAAELCRQMLAYAGKGRFVVEPIDLGALASGLVPLLEVSVARKAVLRLIHAPGIPAVLADATQLRQIVMNLVLNAADAIGDRGGEIVISTGLMHADHASLNAAVTGAGLAEGDYVFIEVRDTGCGMTSEVIAKIFDPFYTTKFAGRGLGLAAVLGIVRSHHGALQVTSEPGQGSTFRLLLPPVSTNSPGSRAAAPAVLEEPWQHNGDVIIIEDEEHVRGVAAHLLKSFGLSPRLAPDGRSGLALFRENPAACEFVLLDLVMPGLSGEETLAALRIMRPDIPVLIMSGYNEGDLLRRLAAPESPLAFLPKPFTRESLAEKIRELLG